ncbi:peptide chain release factor-like protein [candidate division FCPU426 bacterium]|nr:peptide chain release factor-like protein [candidate division FCPU426 bacterium]
MPHFPVSEKKQNTLAARMAALGLREEDLAERFLRSGGPGGQHTNKVSTCVVLRHLPTGLEVRCQKERSQSLNRYWARRLMADKLDEQLNKSRSQIQQAREKIRRQKRRRSRRSKEKMLMAKHHQSQKKQRRSLRPDQQE